MKGFDREESKLFLWLDATAEHQLNSFMVKLDQGSGK